MEYRLSYLDEVDIDIDTITIWYKDKQQGLELDFSAELVAILKRIERMPFSYPIRYDNIRHNLIGHATRGVF